MNVGLSVGYPGELWCNEAMLQGSWHAVPTLVSVQYGWPIGVPVGNVASVLPEGTG